MAGVNHRVVVPLRAGAGKSRLTPPPGVDRAALATAMAYDTLVAVAAVVGWERLVVVGGGRDLADDLSRRGVTVCTDPGSGLDAAVSCGLAEIWRTTPLVPWAVLLGDLPALDAATLRTVMDHATYRRCLVPDWMGTGTVLVSGRPGVSFTPSYGAGSAARHAVGAQVLGLDAAGLRCDVDTAEDLTRARDIGLGPHTRDLLGWTA